MGFVKVCRYVQVFIRESLSSYSVLDAVCGVQDAITAMELREMRTMSPGSVVSKCVDSVASLCSHTPAFKVAAVSSQTRRTGPKRGLSSKDSLPPESRAVFWRILFLRWQPPTTGALQHVQRGVLYA